MGEQSAGRRASAAVHIEVGENCACFAVRKAARAVTQLYDAHLAEVGLKTTQFTLLNSVAGYRSISVNALAEALVMDRTTLTRNLKPLQDQGLIEQRPSADDKRVRLLSLTPAGEKLFSRALPVWRKAHGEFLAKVGEPRWRILSKNLNEAERAISGV